MHLRREGTQEQMAVLFRLPCTGEHIVINFRIACTLEQILTRLGG